VLFNNIIQVLFNNIIQEIGSYQFDLKESTFGTNKLKANIFLKFATPIGGGGGGRKSPRGSKIFPGGQLPTCPILPAPMSVSLNHDIIL